MGTKMDELIRDMNKKAKETIITKGLSEYTYQRIPFTSPRMNYCTYGGIPVGKLIEFYGEEHGGKTTTALDIIANYQNMKDARGVLFVDAENTLDVEWSRKIGVNIEEMYILQPKSQYAEEIFDLICEAVDTGEIGLWVLDSIGALMSKQESEKDMEEKTYGGISQPLTRFGKKIEMLMQRHKCTGIGINQIREDLNSQWGGTTTPGGKAWKHFCAVRMEFRRGKFLDDKGNELTRSAESPSGNIVLMSMTKNKTCPPNRRTGFYSLNYEFGIDFLRDLVDVAIKYDIIDKRGGWFTIIDVETGEVIKDKIQGQANLIEYIENEADVMRRIEELVDDCMLKD